MLGLPAYALPAVLLLSATIGDGADLISGVARAAATAAPAAAAAVAALQLVLSLLSWRCAHTPPARARADHWSRLPPQPLPTPPSARTLHAPRSTGRSCVFGNYREQIFRLRRGQYFFDRRVP